MDKKFIQNKFSEDQLSISDLFTGPVIGSSSTTASFSEDAESGKFLNAASEEENRFIPQINFATASNFARFGSAVSYYEDAFTRIHNQYPYDGSHREKVLWNLSSSYLDKYIFENVYPRTNGYININSGSSTYTTTKLSEIYSSSTPQYVFFKGGPNADPYGNYKLDISTGLSTDAISKANVYDTASNRGNNLEINLDKGLTIEFWMKKNGWAVTPDSGNNKEVIFHNSTTASVNNDSYCLLLLSSSVKSNLFLNLVSGSSTSITGRNFSLSTNLADVADSKWHHYAVTAKNSGSYVKAKLYVDGVYVSEQADSNTLNPITASTQAALGALAGQVSVLGAAGYGPGWGNIISSSFDEFRYWKTERNAKEIGRYHISDVKGGTNTDLANTDLGVYFKFNEGITQTASVDRAVLDYSGRVSNGTIINYDSNTNRSTSSAIIESGKASIEFKDPIIYSFHPSVKSKLADLKIKGSDHDFNNSNSLINSIPAWIVEDDEAGGTGELAKLIQISANYLDTLYLQLEALPTIKNINYASHGSKPHFFNDRLLKDYGFDVDEILTDVSLFAYSKTRDEDRIFERKLYEVKNQIYKNIYNNLSYIYKSKGTIKSFRNLLRCMGTDEELVRLNLYGLNTDWQAKTNSRNIASKVKYLDFFNNNEAIVYGYPETGNSNSNSFISGSGNDTSGIDSKTAITLEADVIFPKYPSNAGNYSKNYHQLTTSIFGMNGVGNTLDPTDLTWPASSNNISSSLSAYVVRKQKQTSDDNPEVFFMVSGSMLSAPITSSIYTDVYDNSKWKLAVRLKHRSQGTGLDFVSGSAGADPIDVEFFGAQVIADYVVHQFKVTGSLVEASKHGPFIKPKRIYCGANRTNFTGSIINRSDVFISNIRYWNSYVNDEALVYHAKNDASYGTEHPYQNTYLFEGKGTTGLPATEMPEISSLALNWALNQVTGSDTNGRFTVADFSSGSNELADYKLSNIVQRQHTARGDFFKESSSEVTEIKYNHSTRLVPFDQINSDDMVNIVDFEGEIFTRESRPQEYFFAFEKSMYANISDEMLNMFATIRDFHNIVGEPVNRYRKEYKEMEKIRQLFFRRVGNTPDIEKFVDYYKWIDNSISTMLGNLIPASANFAKNIRTMVESHVLERNKIETKFPTLELNQPEPIGQIKAINELTYDWKHGHHPASGEQQDGCLYWHDRAERDSTETTSGNSSIDAQRETIRVRKNTVVSGSSYVLRKLTRPYRLGASRTEDFKIDNIKLNFAQTELNKSNPTQNIVLQNIENFKTCNDNLALRSKRKVDFQANVNGSLLKGRAVAPFTIYSSSVSTGYKGELLTFGNQIEINNNHIDAYGVETQEPLQGPFTSAYVGGQKHRRIPFAGGGALAAVGTVTCHSTTLSNYHTKEITITDAHGNIVKYLFQTIATSNTGNTAGGFTLVGISGLSTVSEIAEQLENAIESANGHPDTIVVHRSSGFIKLFQKTKGTSGNVNIKKNSSFTDIILTSTGFSGGMDGLDNPSERPELYTLSVASDNITLSQRAVDEANSTFFEDEIAKRPVNIRNIKILTQSNYVQQASYGNYSKEYQIVQTVGANTQRGWLKDNFSSVTQITPEILNLSGNINFSNFDRGRNSLQSVTIADRFSGPGSPEAMSPGYLDPASHTFSVYNGINYRNMTVRLPRSNVTFTASTGGSSATQYYEFRPFGGNANQNLRTLQTGVPLRNLLRHPMSFEGYDTYLTAPDASVLTASIHKVNRNRMTKPTPSGVFIVNHSTNDNGFVQHPIPRSDRQYSWITASLKYAYAGPNISTFNFYSGLGDELTAPLGYSIKSDDTTFTSASNFGSYVAGGQRIYGYDDVPGVPTGWIPDDFVGLNTNIYDTMTASQNFLGYPSTQTGYKQGATSWQYQGGLVEYGVTVRANALLNGIINHRQGPYGWPSWKQTRGGNHPIIRNHRKTSTFSTINRLSKKPETATYIPDHSAPSVFDPTILPSKVFNDGHREIINFTESAVTVAYKPVTIEVFLKGLNTNGLPQDAASILSQKFKLTFANESAYFAEDKIFKHITLNNYSDLVKANHERSRAYESTVNLYKPGTFDFNSSINPLQQFETLKASQVIWPRPRNTFLKRTKMRNNYTEIAGVGSNGYDRIKHRTFWRDNIEDRRRTDKTALNSQGMYLSQSRFPGVLGNSSANGNFNQGAYAANLSVWPLEGRFTGSGLDLAEQSAWTGGPVPQAYGIYPAWGATMMQAGKGIGYFSNLDGLSGELFGGGMYRSAVLVSSNYSVGNRFVTASARYHGVDWNMSAYSGSATGGNWQAAPLGPTNPSILQYTASSNIEWTTNIDSGKNPWYDSYEDYSADLRVIGKDYSIIPEFNISDHMEYYIVNSGSDFLSPLPKDKFSIKGINNSASVNNTFYKEYSHSDFLKNFDLVIEDHKQIADIKNVKMTCRGLKKLLPYNGFYPVTRTLQLATLLSESIGNKIIGSGSGYDAVAVTNLQPAAAEVQGMQALLQPLMAPGILYNTIKSGIAVDWPLYTGSAPGASFNNIPLLGLATKSYLSSSADYRLPFEAIYNLDELPLTSEDNTNKIYAVTNEATDAHFTWDGERNHDLYEKAINNFLAESVNLFLHESKLTSFASKKMSEVSFKSGVRYEMSVDLVKSANFIMTEGASADSVVNSDIFHGAQQESRSYGFMGTSKRGIIYGPAVRFFNINSSSVNHIANLSGAGWPYCEQNDPAFAPYTPPYFYGKSTVDLVYNSTVDDTETPTLAMVFANITASYSNNLSNIPGAFYTSSSPRSTGYPWRGVISSSSPAIQSMMHLSSSINLFGRTNDALKQYDSDGQVVGFIDPEDPSDQERWVMSTKYECPVLDFGHYTNDTKARGMWNGYGKIPNYDTEGIHITLRETNPEIVHAPQKASTGSLLQKFFGTGVKRKPVGELAKDFEKSISECIVAIPYLPGNSNNNPLADSYNCAYSPDDDKYFFPVTPKKPIGSITGGTPGGIKFKDQNFAPSVKALQQKMKKFVFPPRYDWVNNEKPALAPFAMFAFEFNHKLTRQELADIWQGVMPDIAMKVVPETTTLNIPVTKGELMAPFFVDVISAAASKQKTYETIKGLKWMVFKVKQRARNVYANITEDIADNVAGTFFGVEGSELFVQNDDTYSYNWPYDFCSLVELGKVETEIEIK